MTTEESPQVDLIDLVKAARGNLMLFTGIVIGMGMEEVGFQAALETLYDIDDKSLKLILKDIINKLEDLDQSTRT